MPARGRGSSFRSISRGGYSDRGSNFSSSGRYDSMSRRPRDFVSSYGHKSEMEMTKALVSSVLESGAPRGMRHFSRGMRSNSYKHHSRNLHSEDFGHDRKKFVYKDSERPMREPRMHSEGRRYPKEHRDQHFSRPSIISKDNYKYVERSDFPGPSMKRQRISGNESYSASKFPMQREPRSHFKPYQRFEPKGSYIPRGRGHPNRDYQRFPIKASGRLSFNTERMLPFKRKRSSSRDDRPMKVTIRSSGRRQVDGTIMYNHGGEHVQLKCPHCPGYEAITFKAYRFHLDSQGHTYNLNKLIRKHSAVLRKIRLQQRENVRDTEEAMNKENSEKFRSAEKEFCGFCKLVYKVFSSTAQAEHEHSRFHKMQVQYLKPYCKLCKMNLPSLMVYEHHTASIRHLRSMCEKKAAKSKYNSDGEREHQDDKDEDFDMANFVTMDAVGEDVDAIGDDVMSLSDDEEITGKLEDVEAAIKETKADYNESHEDSELKHSTEDEAGLTERNEDDPKLHSSDLIDEDSQSDIAEHDDDSLNGEKATQDQGLLVEDYRSDDDQSSDVEPVGAEYLCEIEAMLCRLCGVAIRMDYIGSEALDRHCKSIDHITRYNDLLKQKSTEDICSRTSSRGSNNDLSDTPDQKEDHSPNYEGSPTQSGDEEDAAEVE